MPRTTRLSLTFDDMQGIRLNDDVKQFCLDFRKHYKINDFESVSVEDLEKMNQDVWFTYNATILRNKLKLTLQWNYFLLRLASKNIHALDEANAMVTIPDFTYDKEPIYSIRVDSFTTIENVRDAFRKIREEFPQQRAKKYSTRFRDAIAYSMVLEGKSASEIALWFDKDTRFGKLTLNKEMTIDLVNKMITRFCNRYHLKRPVVKSF